MHQVIHSVPTFVFFAAFVFVAAFAVIPLSTTWTTRQNGAPLDETPIESGQSLIYLTGARYGATHEPEVRDGVVPSHSFHPYDAGALRDDSDDDGNMPAATKMANAIERLRSQRAT